MRKMTLALAVLASLGGALATSASAAPGAPVGVTATDSVQPVMHRRGMMHHHMRHHRMMHRRHMMRRHMMHHRMERRMMRRM